MRRLFTATFVVSVTMLGFAGSAAAGPIVAPGTVIANTMGEFGPAYAVDGLLDQSGLSAPYVSGVTDFATYTATTTEDGLGDTAGWLSAGPNVLPGHIDFDLGSAMLISSLALWNHAAGSSANVQNFRIFESNDALFSSSVLVGTFVNPQGVGSIYAATVYDLIDNTARYWRLQIDSFYGNPCCVAVGEVALEAVPGVAAVPEPASMVLLGTGVAGLVARARRKRQAR